MSVPGRQDFRLTWVNYSQKLTESFHKFLTSEILCNVTLWVHSKTSSNCIKAHQAILSACSPWFETILSQNQHPHPIIILKDVRYQDLKSIIRFIYTGEVFVPQHELQGFLRTAELLEIKGLLKDVDEVSWPQQGVSGSTQPMSHQQQPINNNSLSSLVQTTNSKLALPINLNNNSNNNSNGMIGNSSQTVLPSLPTVPVSTIVLTNAMADNSQLYDLVSQIKVPVSVQQNQNNPSSGDDQSGIQQHQQQQTTKKRKNDQRKYHHASASKKSLMSTEQQHQQQQESPNGNNPLLPQSAVEEDGVSWIEEAPSTGDVDCLGDHATSLTPSEWVTTGINDCGAFKRSWAERYLCYNLGREIICLLCFCRFTQFKKFNLERHMKNKHPQVFGISERDRGLILERYITRYIDHITSATHRVGEGGGSTGQDIASEILSVGPIQQEDLDPHDTISLSSVVKEEMTANEEAAGHVVASGVDSHHHIMVECELEEHDGEILLVK